MSRPAWDVIGIGENSVDDIYRLPEPPVQNAKMRIASHRLAPGGQVATTLCACASLGLRAKYLGVFGSDDNGRRIREELGRRGVDTGEAVVRDAPNRHALILVDDRTGERTVLWERDARLALHAEDVRPEVIQNARLLHVDAEDEEAAIIAARIARTARVWVTSDVDRCTNRTEELLSAVDVAILSEHLPHALTGDGDVEDALRALRRRHKGWLCVTLGARGAMMLDGERLHHAPAYQVDVVDTTGAGDVFRAGFIYALLRGDAPQDILKFANAAAAVSCTRTGAIDGVPTLAEVEAVLATKSTKTA